MEKCDHTISLDLSTLFLYAPSHNFLIFKNFLFDLEAFFYFKINCFLMRHLMAVSSAKFIIFISLPPICTSLILLSASVEIANALVTPLMNSLHMDKGLK